VHGRVLGFADLDEHLRGLFRVAGLVAIDLLLVQG